MEKNVTDYPKFVVNDYLDVLLSVETPGELTSFVVVDTLLKIF